MSRTIIFCSYYRFAWSVITEYCNDCLLQLELE